MEAPSNAAAPPAAPPSAGAEQNDSMTAQADAVVEQSPSAATDQAPDPKEEPAVAGSEEKEPRYVVDDSISEEELAQSIKSMNDFSLELQRTRLLLQKRLPAQHHQTQPFQSNTFQS